jgi:hypothetical protein
VTLVPVPVDATRILAHCRVVTRIGWSLPAASVAASLALACEGDSQAESSSGNGVKNLGAFTFTLAAPDPATVGVNGRTCHASGTFGFGNPPPSPTARGGLLDGFGDGRSAFCVVAPTGSGLYVDVSASSDTNEPEMVSLQLLGDVDSTSGAGELGATIATPPSGYLTDADPCTLGPIRTLAPGEIYADFTCPLLRPIMSDANVCAASGTVEFRDCAATLDD